LLVKAFCPDTKQMRDDRIAGNTSIDTLIHHCVKYICREDELKFRKKLREQPHDSDQIMHTFRELILGAYLCSSGVKVRYEYTVESKTPDWCILDDNSMVKGIIELINFHIDKTTEDDISEQMRNAGLAIYWRDKHRDNVDRLYHCMWDKIQVYRAVVEELRIPYVIAIFGEFSVAVDFKDDLWTCLNDKEFGLFQQYPELSGALYFEENSGKYLFEYAYNSSALRSYNLPSNIFPPVGA